MLKKEIKSIIEDTKFIFLDEGYLAGNTHNLIKTERDFAEAVKALDELTSLDTIYYEPVSHLKKVMSKEDLKSFIEPIERVLKAFAIDMNIKIMRGGVEVSVDDPEVNLACMIKNFELLPRDIDWDEKDPITGKHLTDHPVQEISDDEFYRRMYYVRACRNQTHSNEVPSSTIKFNPETIPGYQNNMIVLLLHICFKYKEKIKEKYSEQVTDLNQYLKHIENEYADLINEYTYLDVKWGNEKEHSSFKDICQDTTNLKPVLFYGSAGIGKTTTLHEIEHYYAKDFQDKKVIPFYLELKDVMTSSDSDAPYILNGIVNKLNRSLDTENDYLEHRVSISLKEVLALLGSYKTVLLLDGFNEISKNDQNIIKQETRKILNKYKNTCKVFVTNRTSDVIVPSQKEMTLDKLTTEDKKEFFNKNCNDENTRKIILDELDTNELKFKDITTPYFLKNYVEYVQDNMKVPDDIDDFIAYCIRNLKRREQAKEENKIIINWMGNSLSNLAKEIYYLSESGKAAPNELHYDTANDDGWVMSQQFFRKTVFDYLTPVVKNSTYGENTDTVIEQIIEMSVGMGIIQEDGDSYLFKKEYYNCFRKDRNS